MLLFNKNKETKKLVVEKMHCQHCVNSITSALKEKKVSCNVNLDNKEVTVKYDTTKITIEEIINTINSLGFEVK